MRVPFFLHPHSLPLLIWLVFNFSHFSRYLVVPHCGFNMLFPNVKHLFMLLFAICMSSPVKCILTSFACLWGIYLFISYIPDVLSGIWFAKIFSQFMACHFSHIFFKSSFPFRWGPVYKVVLVQIILLVVYIKNICIIQGCKGLHFLHKILEFLIYINRIYLYSLQVCQKFGQ